MPPLLEIRDLLIHRNRRPVLEVEHLDVLDNETLAVIGPNGAGKSTLLLAVSQLIRPERGEIRFRGEPLAPRAALAYRRRLALVLQDPLLFDASVFENVALGLRFRGLGGRQVTARVEDWLERLGIAPLRQRRARTLSGGEAQRVSLARALALNPDLLLLDEPFSALDAPSRARLLDDYHSLVSTTSITTLFVTHDMDEAIWLGDRVAVLLNGQLRQVGTPEAVFSAPADPDIAALVGVETVIAGRVTGEVRLEGQPPQSGDRLLSVEAGGFKLEAIGQAALGRPVWLCLRPEAVTLWVGTDAPPAGSSARSSGRNRLRGRISRMTPQGPLLRVVVDCPFPIVALITRLSAQEMGLQLGGQVAATFKASAAHLIAR
jgi:ABC-type Fe3+/spermidine/putrescine transport system ATPase subunit